jgi:hypothetical protein
LWKFLRRKAHYLRGGCFALNLIEEVLAEALGKWSLGSFLLPSPFG